jgi:TonB family protein
MKLSMTRILVLLCALVVGASANPALSANGNIPSPRPRPDRIGTTVPIQADQARANWVLALVDHIRAQTSYPELARLFGSEGRVLVHFVLDRKGAVHDVRIVQSSGSLLLDGRSVQLLYQAQPFPPPPDELAGELAGDQFEFIVPLRYCLQCRPGGAAAQQQQSPTGVGTAIGAQQNFDRSVADYRQCIAANPNNANACEGLRHIMDANAQVLSGHPK